MKPDTRSISATFRRLLKDTDRAEAMPSAAFLQAAAGADFGVHPSEITAAIKKLEDAEAANDSGPIARALAAAVGALR